MKWINNLFVFVFMCVNLVLCQEDVKDPAPLSRVVCDFCSCQDSSVDCHSRGATLFTKEDWNAIEIGPLQIDLSGNNLPTLSQFPSLPTQTLNLSRCAVNTIEKGAFKNLENLTSLDLSYNDLTLMQHVFLGPAKPGEPPQQFRQLRYLNLSHNELHTLPDGVFRFFSNIRTLDLAGNPLAAIDVVTMGAIADLVYLTDLNLEGCELESIPEGLFHRLTRLKYLDLSANRFTTLPSVLAEATSLVTLNLNRNPIKIIEAVDSIGPLKTLNKLQELYLNRLSTLEYVGANSLGGLESLTILQLSHNPRLTTVDPLFLQWTDDNGVERWPILKELHINNNSLTEINSNYVMRWDKVTTIDVSHNPFTCECTNQWMLEVLMPIIEDVDVAGTSDNMICNQPAELRGMTFKQLYVGSKKLTCQQSDLASLPDPQDAVVIGIMIGIFVTFPLVLVIILMWKRGYLRRCRGKPHRRRPSFYDDEDNY